MSVSRLACHLAELPAVPRLGVAMLAGAFSVLALPPVHLIPVLLISLPLFVWTLDGLHQKRQALLTGWSFGFGFFVAGLYWIGNALLIDAERFGWMVVPALVAIGLGLGLYCALLGLLLHLSGLRGLARVMLFAALWTGLEMLRGVLFTGFPWNPMASVWMPVVAIVQWVAWIGASGLSLLTVFLMTLPALAGDSVHGWQAVRLSKTVWAATAGVAILFAVGHSRLPAGDAPLVEDVRLRLVQPDISQKDKWQSGLRAQHLSRYLSYSLAEGDRPVTHVLWGETALSYPLDGETDGELRAAVAEAIADTDDHRVEPALLTGVIRRTPPESPSFQIWNSFVALDRQGTVRGQFDKYHLVPFGEYMPLRSVFPFLAGLTVGGVDFNAGPGPRTLNLPGLPPVSPLVCYEAIFPAAVVDPNNRPDWLLNVTNDGWYGMSSGPYQHLALTVLRAVEEGLPLVRVANTGVSVIVDPWGRTLTSLGLGDSGFADGPLPRPLPPTLFSHGGQAIPFLLVVLAALGAVLLGRTSRF